MKQNDELAGTMRICTPKAEVTGSNPVGCATFFKDFTSISSLNFGADYCALTPFPRFHNAKRRRSGASNALRG